MVGRSDARARKSGVIVPTQYAYAVRVSSQPYKRKNAVLPRARPRQVWSWAQRDIHLLHDASPLWGSNPRPYATKHMLYQLS